eukprot:GHVT01071682.1.p1 GENE.GHVT01071682.1~~GHVT01071682.1.p1  ORF type:complete len:156 (-),score=31.07 GHVT01071682.1:2038-2505(-)
MASLKPSLLRKLAAVGYGGTVGCARAEVSEVVVFLEEEIIRFRPREERKVLREVNEAWWPNFKQYCKALGVAVRQGAVESPLARLSLLDQIASIAVHDAYLDKVEGRRPAHAGAVPRPQTAAENECAGSGLEAKVSSRSCGGACALFGGKKFCRG